MAISRLHLICGNCGCSNDWEWTFEKDAIDCGDGTFKDEVYITCKNCSTLHPLSDYAGTSSEGEKLEPSDAVGSRLSQKGQQCLNCQHSRPKNYMALDCSKINSIVEYDYSCPHWEDKGSNNSGILSDDMRQELRKALERAYSTK